MKIKLLTDYILAKKIGGLLQFKKSFLVPVVFLLVCGKVWGQATITLVPNAATTGNNTNGYVGTETAFNTTSPAISWIINNWNPSTRQMRGNTSAAFYLANTSALPGGITNITITNSSATLVPNKVFLLTGNSEQTGTSGGVAAGTGSTAVSSVSWAVTGGNKFFKIYLTSGGTSGTAINNNITITYSTSPTLNASTLGSSITATYGNASATGVVSSAGGSNLTGNITVTPNTGFEVSSTNATSGFTASAISVASGSNNIWLRFSNTKAAGTYNNNVAAVLSGGGASSNANIVTSASGNVVSKATPTISGTGVASNITFGQSLASSTISGFTASVPGTFAFTTPSTAPNAGTASYGVTFTPTDTSNYNNATTTVSVTTVPATPTVTATGTTTYTYNGTPQGPASATNTGTGSSYIFSYSGTENGGATYGPITTRPSNAGTYQMVATVAAAENYSSASSSPYGFTINRAASTITVTGATSYAYNGSEHGPTTYDHTGSSGAVTFHYTGVGSTSYPESATRPTAVGTYKAVATLAADNNYASAVSDDFNFQITSVAVPQITSALTWSVTYGVAATTYTVTASNSPTSFTVTGLPAGLSYNSGTHEITGTPTIAPGNYQVTLSATNEGGTGNEVTLVITVAQKPVTIADPVVADKVYDGNTTAVLTGTASGFVNSDDVTLVLSANFSDANAGQDKPVTSTSTLTGTKASYYVLTQPTGLTADISKATPTVAVTGGNTFTFSGLAQGPETATVTPSDAGAVSYSYTGTENEGAIYGPSSSRPSNAGSYNVVATVAATANYNAASSSAYPFTIGKANQALEGFGADIVKLSSDVPFNLPSPVTSTGGQTVTYTITNTPNAGVATISVNTVTIKGIGTTGITAHADGNNNFNAYDDAIDLTVNFNTAGVPVASAATNILGTGFIANWSSIFGATSYELDVYTKNVTSTPVSTDVSRAFNSYGFENTETFPEGVIATGQLSFTTETNQSGSDPAYYNTGSGIRLYGNTSNGNGNTFTLNISGGVTVTGIEFERGTGSQTATYSYFVDGATSAAGTGSFTNGTGTTAITGITAVSNFKIRNTSTGGNSAARLSAIKVYYTYNGTSTSKVLIPGSPFTIPAQDPQPSNYTRLFDNLDRNTQYYYVVRAINGGAETGDSNEIAVKTTNAVVWNGTAWSNNNEGPDATIDAEIIEPYTSPEGFQTKNLTITGLGSLNIQSQQDVTVNGNITLPSDNKIIIENDGNLIQTAAGADTNPTNFEITAKRIASLPKQGYTYWSSPLSGQNLYSFSDGYNSANGGTGTGTPWNRFYVYNEANDYFVTNIPGEITLNSSSTFQTGRGYAIRGMEKFGDAFYANEFAFNGKINNGQLFSQPLKNSCAEENTCDKGYNLIGNPYPSSLDFDALYAANSDRMYATAYFWTNSDVEVLQQTGSNYEGNNYAVYNLSGGTGPADPDPESGAALIPTGKIKLGQGFIIKAKVAGKGQPVEFNNSMRRGYDAGAEFYSKKNEDRNRFWLTMTSPDNIANTILLAYTPEATNDFEMNYDGEYLVIGSDAFYSTLDSRKLAIQGRASFTDADQVALGNVYSKDGVYKISIRDKEGIFNAGQIIYLKDKLLNKTVNLSQEDYSFTATKGTDETRFEVVYKQAVLGTDNAVKSEFQVYRDGTAYVVSSSKKLGRVEIYDTAGRLMKTLTANDNNVRIDTSGLVNGVYIIKAENSGDVKTKKIIK